MIPNCKCSPKWTANDPQRKIGMACIQVSGWSCQFYYYYKTSDLKRNFTSQINTWKKTIWKKSFKCKQATHVLPECCLFQWIFSPVGRLCSGGKRFGWANVIFAAYISYWEVMTHILIFCGYCFWTAWLLFGARAFPLTSFEMRCSSWCWCWRSPWVHAGKCKLQVQREASPSISLGMDSDHDEYAEWIRMFESIIQLLDDYEQYRHNTMVGHLFQNYDTIYVRFFPTYTCNHSCYTIYVRFFVTYTCVLFPSI